METPEFQEEFRLLKIAMNNAAEQGWESYDYTVSYDYTDPKFMPIMDILMAYVELFACTVTKGGESWFIIKR